MKLNHDVSLALLKAHLVAKGYSQVYVMDYQDTSLDAKMTFVWILISLTTTYHWPLHQFDVKNIFPNGILDEKVYMKQQHGLLLRGSLTQAEKIEWIKAVTESLVWMVYFRYSSIWSFSYSE